MEFRLLGPLEVVVDGRPLDLPGGKPRALLALLLLEPGRVVSAARIVDVLWGESAPATAPKIVQGYVSQMRKRLPEGLLQTRAPGYLMRIEEGQLDLARFKGLRREAAAATAEGRADLAAERLRAALALWRGPALADVAVQLELRGEIAHLDELRLAALGERIDADLGLGHHAQLVGELEALVAEHPLHERLRAQLMLALYRCGRQADALDSYRQARRTLVDELGIEPGLALQQLERRILAQDAALALPEVEPSECPSPPMSEPPAEPREERKVVTALVVDLVGGSAQRRTSDPEDVRAFLRPYTESVQRQVERFGGTLQGYGGEGVVALFGAPVTREDDPERALRAAFAIVDDVATHGLEARVAVATGEALVAVDGEQGGAVAAGDVVTIAVRLQAAGTFDGVVVTERTQRATEHVVQYAGPDEVGVRGRHGKLQVWRAVSLRPTARPSPAGAGFVGRHRELGLLLDALSRATVDHEPQLVTVVGVPGIGKSRLVFELARHVARDSGSVLWRQGRSLPYGEGVSLFALTEIVKAQAAIRDTDGSAQAADKLRDAVAAAVADTADREWIAGQLLPLVGHGASAAGERDHHTESFAAWRHYFEALAELHPLVLLFEDLHWADELLLDFVEHLAEWASEVPLLVLCTARPSLLDRRPQWGGGKRNALTVSLAPLSDGDTAQLLAALLNDTVVAAERQAALVAHAGGNPLFAEQYALMARELGPPHDLAPPDTVKAVIAARLDALGRTEKALLHGAAVVGRVFWAGAVAAVESVADVEKGLRTLVRKEFIRRERHSTVEGEPQYAFRHVLLRDVAYEQIPRAERVRMHLGAAEWLESIGGEQQAEIVAHHYVAALEYAVSDSPDRAALAERARLALWDAGNRARSLSSFAAAAAHYDRALELWPPDDPGLPLLLLRAGAVSGADELTLRARDAFLAGGDREAAAEAEAHLGHNAYYGGRREEGARYYETALALLADSPTAPTRAVVLARSAYQALLEGRYPDAMQLGRESLAIADPIELEEARLPALMAIGATRQNLGDLGGLDELLRALELGRAANWPGMYVVHGNIGSFYAVAGDLQASFAAYGHAAREAERFGLPGALGQIHASTAQEHYYCGRWDEAVALIETVERGPSSPMGFLRQIVRGRIRLARAERDAALRDAEAALAGGAGAVHDLHPSLAFMARALAETGHLDEARATFDRLLASWQGDNPLVTAIADLAAVAVELDRAEQLVQATKSATAPSRWLEAACAFVTTDFARAARLYAEIGSVPDQALARLRLGESLIAAGHAQEAEQHLAFAHDFYRTVGAHAYLCG